MTRLAEAPPWTRPERKGLGFARALEEEEGEERERDEENILVEVPKMAVGRSRSGGLSIVD